MIKPEGEHYIYRHIRLDTGEPFYIGIGTKRKGKPPYERANTKHSRRPMWHNIVRKAHYEVEILLESDDFEFIKQKEIEFITLYGRRDLGTGILTNHTKGGDAWKGYKHTEESLQTMSENNRMVGKTHGLNPAAKAVINTLTLDEYSSGREVAEILNIDQDLFRGYLTGKSKNPTYFVYLEKYTGEVHYPEKVIHKDSNAYRKKLYNLDTWKIYENLEEVATEVGICKSTLKKNLYKRNFNIIYLKDYLDRKLM